MTGTQSILKQGTNLVRSPIRIFIISVLIAVGLTVAVMVAFFSVPVGDTQLNNAKNFLMFRTNGFNDSWVPMTLAVEYLQSKPSKLLYDKIFFEDGVKFQYPPTSLLGVHLLETDPVKPFLASIHLSQIDLLNVVNWIATAVLIIVSVWLFLISRKRFMPMVAEQTGTLNLVVDILLLVILCLVFDPVLHAFSLGQAQVWIDALFGIAVLGWVRGNKALAGAFIALACLVKPQYGLIVLWGLLRRQWKFVGVAIMVLVVGFSISVLVYGLDNNLNYLKALSFISQRGEAYFYNDSVNGILNRLLFNGDNLNFSDYVFPPYNPIVYYGTLLTTVIFIGAALVLPRKLNGDICDFFIISLSSTIASPVAWHHHYGILLPVFLFLIPYVIAKKPWGKFSTVWLAISFILCASLLPVLNLLAPTYLNFLQAYVFWGAFLLLILLYGISRNSEKKLLLAQA